MSNLILSRYTIPFEYNGYYLLYNSKSDAFLQVNEDLYNDLLSFAAGTSSEIFDDEETVATLLAEGILTSAGADDLFSSKLIFENVISSYSKDSIYITLAPTISCNLSCPYCYETHKRPGKMSTQTCDKVISFIKRTCPSKNLHLGWYGGEPLLASKIINYFLNQLAENDINLVEHTIVTNGTLLNKENMNVFHKFPLDSIQVTLDGVKKLHDSIRFHHNGNGTFDEIISNLSEFCTSFPNTKVSIRVNIGKHNIDDFERVYHYINDKFDNNKNILVYPGILQGDNDCGFQFNLLDNKELSEFYIKLIDHGILMDKPEVSAKGCTASMLNAFVIGPHGEIYKCWNDIGFEDREIGNVGQSSTINPKIFLGYMIQGTFWNDSKCLECSLLPVCSGGCPHNRLKNKINSGNVNLCSNLALDNNNVLKKLLYVNYKNRIKENI